MKQETRTRIRRRLIEGTVIVISILLAFAIDALWAQRQVRNEEKTALAALEIEFTANLKQIDRVIEVYVNSREHVASLVRMSPEEIRALPQTTVSEIMLATGNVWSFDPVQGTTSALMSAGKLDIIQDAQLREALTTFTNQVADASEEVAMEQIHAIDIWRAETRLGGPWTDPATERGISGPIQGLEFIPKATPEDLLRVRADAEFMGLVSRFHLNGGYYVSELERLRGQVVLILDLIAGSA